MTNSKTIKKHKELYEATIKSIWNEAVEATLKEVSKYDGIIPTREKIDYLVREVKKKVLYK